MLLWATLWAFHRRLQLAFLGVWFFFILAPTSSFWPLPTEIAAERRMYLPLAAVIVLIVTGGHMVLRETSSRLRWQPRLQRFLEAALVLTIAAMLAYLTVQRNEDYRRAESFWSDVLAKRPNNARGHVNLGHYLLGQGKIDEALSHFSRAVRIKPNDALAHTNLGAALARQGRLDEAIAHYSEALRIAPNDAEAHASLGAALARQGRLDEAIAHYSEALRIDPNHALAHTNLGAALAGQGKLEEAIAHYSEALRIDPNHALAHYNLGITLARDGKIQEAIRHLEEALRLDPTFQQARQALDNLKGVGALRR